jgi:hypothetical protein
LRRYRRFENEVAEQAMIILTYVSLRGIDEFAIGAGQVEVFQADKNIFGPGITGDKLIG